MGLEKSESNIERQSEAQDSSSLNLLSISEERSATSTAPDQTNNRSGSDTNSAPAGPNDRSGSDTNSAPAAQGARVENNAPGNGAQENVDAPKVGGPDRATELNRAANPKPGDDATPARLNASRPELKAAADAIPSLTIDSQNSALIAPPVEATQENRAERPAAPAVEAQKAEEQKVETQKLEVQKAKPDSLPSLEITSAPKTHEVKKNDTLWKAASDALKGTAHSGSDVSAYIKQIVEANKGKYPELKKNPDMIHTGMKLDMPDYKKASSDKHIRPEGEKRTEANPQAEQRKPGRRNPEEAKPGAEPKPAPEPKPQAEKRPVPETAPKPENKDKPVKPEKDKYTPTTPGDVQTGKASFYGGYFHGRLTANGERYDQMGMTVAHKTLPFGTIIKVENPANGKSVELRVTDRGPFVKGRELDLSVKAAQLLGTTEKGVATVNYKVVGKGWDGPYADAARARRKK